MSLWYDDGFEPEVQNLAPPPAVEDVQTEVKVPKGKAKLKDTKKGKVFNMEDLGRELTPKEREEIERRNDEDDDEDHYSWDKVMTKEEFENWGEKAGKYFATRHKAGNYGHFLSKFISTIAVPLDVSEIRKMSNLLKTIADDKTVVDKDKNTAGGAKAAAKGNAKPSLKGGKGGGGSMYDDYEGGTGGKHDDYDDIM